MFKNIKEVNLNFNSCDNCPKTCCKNILIPLILEDFELVYKNFPIIFAYISNELRVLILLGNDGDKCRYLSESGCTIYEERPPSCKMYPISPFFEDFYVDTACEAVGESGEFLCSKDGFNKSFYHPRVESFTDKYFQTQKFLLSIENDIEKIGEVKGVEIYKYSGGSQNKYINMHKTSLEKL